MRNLIENISKIATEEYVCHKDVDSITLSANDLKLKIYDKKNLVGFTISGDIQGKEIYIVHDTDNYDETNLKYQHLYNDAIKDAQHVASMLVKHRIRINSATKKGLFKNKDYLQIVIPNENGEEITYPALMVNTNSFYDG